jgi:poly(3-hydroxybutyrate) depolymerase
MNRGRVYATGMSNGALLAHQVACGTNLFATIVVHESKIAVG